MRSLLLPGRANLHVASRIAVGIIANLVVALFVVPTIGKTAPSAKELLGVGLPAFAIITLLPVIGLGRDVPRMLAIGLCVLPSYCFVVGCINVFSNLAG